MSDISDTQWENVNSKGLVCPMPMTLWVAAHMASLLRWLHSNLVALLRRYSTLLVSPSFWGYHYNFHFIPTASCTVLSRAPSLASQAPPWNLDGYISAPTVLAFWLLTKISITWTITRFLPVQTLVKPTQTMAATGFYVFRHLSTLK